MKFKFRADKKDVIIFAMYCIILLILVSLGVVNLNYLSTEGKIYGMNFFRGFMPDMIVITLSFYLIALIASLTMITSSKFYSREKGFGWTGSKKDDPGFARWSEEKEVKERKEIEKIVLKDEEYKAAGIPIMLNEKEAQVDNGEFHSLIIGSTGSGKTQCVILPMVKILAKAGESMIITDPKAEIYKDTSALLKAKGYNVILLNFREPQEGNCWNPLTLPYKFYKAGELDKSNELLADLATNIVKDANNKGEPFWEDSAADYFKALSMALFEDAKEEEININSINVMSTLGESKIPRTNVEYIKEYFNSKGKMSEAYITGSATIDAPNDTKMSITSTFKTKVSIFASNKALSEMLSRSDFDFSKIGREKTAIFLSIHDEKKTYHSLMTIFIKQVYESLVAEAQKETSRALPIRTNFLLDEFANMPALKDVDAMITAARSRKMRFNFIIQNFSQLSQTYGAEMAETIRGNCGNIHYLLTTELKALEEISKLIGDQKPKDKKDKPQDPIRPLMSVRDLQQMKQYEFIIIRHRSQPFKTKFTPDWQLMEKNIWGINYEFEGFPHREREQVAIFDLQGHVNKYREEQMEKMANDPEFMKNMNPMQSKMPGMGAMGGAPRNPFGMPPSNNMGMPGMGGGLPNNMDLDEIMKNIDKQIAEFEKQEKLEKEKNKPTQDKEPVKEKPKIEEETINSVEKQIEDLLKETEGEKPKKEEPTPEIKKSIEDLIKEEPNIKDAELVEETIAETNKEDDEDSKPIEDKKEEKPIKFVPSKTIIEQAPKKKEEPIKKKESLNPFGETPEIKKPIVEKKEEPKPEPVVIKPKIKIDSESKIVKTEVTDDQFFDDFFGDDEI